MWPASGVGDLTQRRRGRRESQRKTSLVFSVLRVLCNACRCGRSAGFQTCCVADFQIGRAWKVARPAGFQTRDTPDLEVCATLVAAMPRCASALIVEEKVIVDLKAKEEVIPLDRAKLLSYLRLSHLRLGLIINFDSIVLKDGIARVVNGLASPPLEPGSFSL